MNRLRLVRTTGLLIISLVVLLNIPYTLLIQNFEYDAILRKPVGYVLTQFQAGGGGLILTWFSFGLAALLFIPASVLLHQILVREDTPYLAIATTMGVLSGAVQAVGLMRWVFVIPVLANLYTDPKATETTREAVSVVYQAVHQYGGVALGEHLGQTLLACWTLGIGLAMRHSRLLPGWLIGFGVLTVPLLLVGQSELLATVMPALPVLKTTVIGFVLWEIWLLMVGVSLLRVPPQRVVPKT
ncbi:MAG: DUF4386 domain-containing protein [Lyngbya sp. HA4199-MV5]|jgi:membrane protein YqaA with SNARE-associated domain|nr:DUF4386 domain-containing protein [Lyngbya sp. HA4199-MV5]